MDKGLSQSPGHDNTHGSDLSEVCLLPGSEPSPSPEVKRVEPTSLLLPLILSGLQGSWEANLGLLHPNTTYRPARPELASRRHFPEGLHGKRRCINWETKKRRVLLIINVKVLLDMILSVL